MKIGVNIRSMVKHYQKAAKFHNEIAQKIWTSGKFDGGYIFIEEIPCNGRFGYEVKLGRAMCDLPMVTYWTRSARQAARLAQQLKRKFNTPIISWRAHCA